MTRSDRKRDSFFAHKAIRLRKQDPDQARAIETEFNLGPIPSRILSARGFGADDRLRNFINPTLSKGLADPACLKNLKEAAELLASSASAGKPVAVCCDFDVDGLSGGAQLHHFLTSAGMTSRVFVPDRFVDGYGLNEGMVEEIAKLGFGLLITVDYGTTNVKEIALARKLGLKTIVIDHHHVGAEHARPDVFINPNQDGCGFADRVLCASGLVWYFIVGVRSALPKAAGIDPKSYLDLACLGTICDMVPLIGANRVIAKRGLELLEKTERVGLRALKQVMSLKGSVSCSDVSFGIGPRLNAAGRMIHGELVIELLTTTDVSRANALARQLNKLNADRQDTEAIVKESAVEKIRARSELPAGLVVWDESYHTGVIGIVAQRLVEHFYRPSIVMGVDSPGIYKGSVRGVRGFNVVESLAAVKKHLLKFGGHEGAGGFSIEADRLDDFERAFVEECERHLSGKDRDPYVEADTEISLSDLEPNLVQDLRRFAPFGMGNPGPLVYIRDLEVADVKVLKGAHLKLMLKDSGRVVPGLMWRQTSHPAVARGARVSVACRPDCNSFNGTLEVQATLQAIEKAG